ncbi:MAG TPA: SdrD B-like domain-containing protein, partial [Gemmatimonadales bacterium]|nr:SdrD B-like domain-containing protein [Gemmatimonadales bacterium]
VPATARGVVLALAMTAIAPAVSAQVNNLLAPPPPAPSPPPLPPPPPPPPVPPPPPPPPPPGPTTNRALGMVWEDIDGNGIRDPFAGEMGLAGWTVQLYDGNGQLLSSQVTDADGNFAFDSLVNGSYSVCVVAQGGYTQTSPLSGTGCGGRGYSFSFSNPFETWATNNDFGEMANP